MRQKQKHYLQERFKISSLYKSKRRKTSAPAEPTKEEHIQMKIEKKLKRGRLSKYTTPEEAKKAKSAKTIESNKRKKAGKIKLNKKRHR